MSLRDLVRHLAAVGQHVVGGLGQPRHIQAGRPSPSQDHERRTPQVHGPEVLDGGRDPARAVGERSVALYVDDLAEGVVDLDQVLGVFHDTSMSL